VRNPQAFLMDEPLSNLDAKLRVEMRLEIARIQRLLNVATVYVTHDQVEAMTMGDRVAVMRDGKLQQVDAPQDLYDRPANEFVAGFMGSPPMNLLACEVRSGHDRIEIILGDQVVELPLSYANTHDLPSSGSQVILGVRPEDVLITDASSSNTIKTRVERSEALGSEILVHLSHAEALDETLSTGERLRQDLARRAALVAKMGPRVKVTAGDILSVQISPEHAHFFDVATGRTLRRS
jgi:multiple sugar transport system ATP-binding protein